MNFYCQAPLEDGSANCSLQEKFLQLSVKDLREIVDGRKKVDQINEEKLDLRR